MHVQALLYLLLISEVEETEIFKICLEYWNTLTSELYHDNPCNIAPPVFVNQQVTLEISPRRLLYFPVLTKVSQSVCQSVSSALSIFLMKLYVTKVHYMSCENE